MPIFPVPGPRAIRANNLNSFVSPPAAAPVHPDVSPNSCANQFHGEHSNTSTRRPRRSIFPEIVPPQLRQARLEKITQKGTPYPSNRGPSGGINLNGRVSVAPSSEESDARSKAVMCRHLAAVFAKHTGKKAPLKQTFSTAAGIRERFHGKVTETEAALLKTIQETPVGCKQVVTINQLGRYFMSLAQTLLDVRKRSASPSHANGLLFTRNHVMAFELVLKKKDGVDYITVKLFDPNITANYMRTEQLTPDDLSTLELKDMLIRPELVSSYMGGEGGPQSMVAVSLDHRLQPSIARDATSAAAEEMPLALRAVFDLIQSKRPPNHSR